MIYYSKYKIVLRIWPPSEKKKIELRDSLILIESEEAKVDLVKFDLKLQENLISKFKKIPLPAKTY
jgi:hypothetical protein